QRSLTEALDQQTATSEILKGISSSPTDVQPVFDAIVRSASWLCDSEAALVARFDGALIHLAPQYNLRPGADDRLPRLLPPPRPPGREMAVGRAIMTGAIVHIPDAQMDPDYDPEVARPQGLRSVLAVPMLRKGKPIGCFGVSRAKPGAFSDRQIELMKTFADQAVIAIENVRLFNETKEALEQQTATADILRVISTSPTDAQPVFEAIAQSAMRLCDATMSVVSRYDGELIHLAAYSHVSAAAVELMRQRFPMAPRRVNIHGRVVLEAGVVHVLDLQADAEYDPAVGPAFQNRSVLGVPMLLEGRVLGAIAVARPEVRPFTDAQIALLKTFGDQAVIAIENVRLFNETKEALERQTATSEILRVISSSPTDLQPVFDTIADS